MISTLKGRGVRSRTAEGARGTTARPLAPASSPTPGVGSTTVAQQTSPGPNDDDAEIPTARPAGGRDRGRAPARTVHRVRRWLGLRLEPRRRRQSAQAPPCRPRASREPLRDLPRWLLRESRGARRFERQLRDVRCAPLPRLDQGAAKRPAQMATRPRGCCSLTWTTIPTASRTPWSAMP